MRELYVELNQIVFITVCANVFAWQRLKRFEFVSRRIQQLDIKAVTVYWVQLLTSWFSRESAQPPHWRRELCFIFREAALIHKLLSET